DARDRDAGALAGRHLRVRPGAQSGRIDDAERRAPAVLAGDGAIPFRDRPRIEGLINLRERSKMMIAYADPHEPMTDLRTRTPAQLLMLAITTNAAVRRRIDDELDRRAVGVGHRSVRTTPRHLPSAA